ncbi:UDP-glycosyltransferase UGT5 [Condylostylus longicornis]|uniref:UDP-glycosyltransferase UGT5 n=1 Tax=Condylostylus longicornis TaxID=2530218 RepID=UPI00244DE08D|nr:UDP-glycosyltransferase UGT5 [Condylostylus longicornis]
MKFNLYLFLTFIASFCYISETKNILGLFPHPGYSHFKVFYPILKKLAENGHQLTVVTYTKSKNKITNYNEIILIGEDTTHVFDIEMFIPSRSLVSMIYEFFLLSEEGSKSCEIFYKSDAIKQIINKNQTMPFDLVITENFNTDCYLGIPYILNVPVIALSSCVAMPWHYNRFALPDTPSFIPSEFVGFNENMNFYERFVNFIITKSVALLYRTITQRNDNKFIKDYLKIDVDVEDLAKKQSLLLINQHYSLSGSRPVPNRVVEIGGVHIDDNDTAAIPKDVEEFLQNSVKGVIFISWGSMIKMSTLPKSKVKAIVNALEQQSFDVLWKWESDDLPTVNKKFMFTKWAPQKELLCHPKVKIFWSHGGLLGTSESVYCGKPIIVSPLYGDQFLNGKAAENRKMGLMLYHTDMSEENLSEAFRTISQPEYAKNAKYVSEVYRNRQNSPLDTAVWWVEHVLKTKGNNLTYSPAADMSGFVYHSLDVITVLVILGILIITIPILICRKCCSSKTQKQKTKKVKVK